MKRRIAAIVLSVALCMSTVMQTTAATFSDQEGAAASAVFTEDSENTGNYEMPVAAEPTAAPAVQEPTATPAPENTEEVTPSPLPAEEVVPTAAPEDTQVASDVEIFDAGEESQEPEVTETPVDVEEVLSAQDGKIYTGNWVKEENKWKLRKPAPAVMTASDNIEEGAVPAEDALMTSESMEEAADPTAVFGAADAAENDADAEQLPQETAVNPDETAADVAGLNTAASAEYYTSSDGIVHIQTYDANNPAAPVADGYYYFDENGYMITGSYVVPAGTENSNYTTDKEHFFMDEANAEWKTEGNTEYTPVNSDLGQMQKGYWLWTGTAFRYYSSNGGFLSVSTLDKLKKNQNKYTGYQSINGEKYFLNNDGTPRTGIITMKEGIRQGEYYAQPAKDASDIPGKVLRSKWRRTVESNGQVQWKKYRSDGRCWVHGIVVVNLDKTQDSSVGDYSYLLSANGNIIKSKMVKAADGYYYCSNKYGRIYKNCLVKYNKARYYFASNGRRVSWKNSWHRVAPKENRYYYFGSTPGKIVEKTGWQRVITADGVSRGWYYFSRYGNHLIDTLASTGRYFRPDGRLASGITTVNGKTYFFQGSTSTTPKGKMYKNQWIRYNNKWYYAGSDGVLYKDGWKYISGYYYYFNSDFTVKTNCAVTKDGKKGYVDSRGRFLKSGWLIINDAKNQVKYIDPDTGNFVVNSSKVINGLRYYFDKDGYRINDMTNVYKGPYYLVADRVNGVMTVYDSTRTVPVKTIRISVGLPGTPTWPTNKDMRLTSYNRWQALMGPSWGQYGTHVDGAGNGGIFVHSVAGSTRSYYNVSQSAYNKLGSPASHGCIRCCVADARWVFYNCNGSTIRIIDGTYNANESMKGPLGRKALVPMYGSKNFDPTDNLAWH